MSSKEKIVDKILNEVKNDPCWKGYTMVGKKKKNGKEVPNCVPAKGIKKANIKNENISIEDVNGNAFAEVIDIIKNPIISESCCSRCGKESCDCLNKKYRGGSAAKLGPDKNYVKPMGEEIEEAVRIPAKTGNIVLVNLTWRGKYYGIKVFFPHTKVPNRKEVQAEIEKVYPGSRVYSFQVSDYEPGQPLIQVSEGAAWTRKEGQNKEGGLNEKGRKSYEKENPGSDLKAPSKEVGNPRRASFCARMRGMRKRQKPSNNTGEDRLSKSLRAWNC